MASRLTVRQLPRTFFNRRWWWTTLLVMVGVTVLLRLGVWQLDRLSQRQLKNAQLIERMAGPSISLNGFAVPVDVTMLRDREATAKGRFDFDRQVVLSQQNWQGSPGGHLITPLRMEGADQAVLVDRGWVPAKAIEAAELSQFDEPEVNEVRGIIQLTETLPKGVSDPNVAERQEWFRVDVEAISRQLPYRLLPFYLLLAPAGERNELPYRIEPQIDLSDGPHLSYAIQWFIFASLLAVGYTRFVMLRGASQG